MAGRKRPPAPPQPDLFVEAGLTPAPPAEAPPKRRTPPPDLSATDDASLSALAFAEAPVALLVLANRRILQANPAAATLFGWPRHLMQGQSVRMLYPSAFEFRTVGERWLRLMRDRPVHEDERVMQAALVVEYLHTATLLHDDVVDGGSTRRGRKAARTLWGDEASVLSGDYLFSLAFHTLTQLRRPDVLELMSNTTTKMASGELLQLTRNSLDSSEANYYEIIGRAARTSS